MVLFSDRATPLRATGCLLVWFVGAAPACERGGDASALIRPSDRARTCMSERGCPSPAPIEPCPAGLDATPLDVVMASAADHVGSAMRVRGPLRPGAGFCTLLWCGDACCNKCSQSLALGREDDLRAKDYARKQRTTIQLRGERVECSGDESRVCCDVEASGQEVIASGTLKLVGTTHVLEETKLCVPPPGPAGGREQSL